MKLSTAHKVRSLWARADEARLNERFTVAAAQMLCWEGADLAREALRFDVARVCSELTEDLDSRAIGPRTAARALQYELDKL